MSRTRVSLLVVLCGLLAGLIGCHGKADSEVADAKTKSGAGDNQAVKPSAKTPIDTDYITDDTVAAFVIHPSRILNSKNVLASFTELSGLKPGGPKDAEEILNGVVQEIGFDPRTLDQAIVLIGAEDVDSLPMMLMKSGKDSRKKRVGPKSEGFRREEKTDGPPRKEPDAGTKTDDCLIAVQPKEDPNGTEKEPFGKESPIRKKVKRAEYGGPRPSFIARFSKAPDQKAILKAISRGQLPYGDKNYENPPALPTATHAGKTYHIAGPMTICFVDDKTLIGGAEKNLKKMLTAKGVATPLTKRLSTLGAEHDLIVAVAGPQVEQSLQMLKAQPMRLPEEYKNVPALIATTKSLAVTFSFTGDPMLSVVLELGDDEKAKELTQVITKHALPVVKSELAKGLQGKPGETPAITKTAEDLLAGLAASQDGRDLVISIKRTDDADNLPKKLMTAFTEAREAARRSTRKNAMRQIGLAFHNYHADHYHFPAHNSNGDFDDKVRKEGLSWRVHLLPYLGQEELYKRFHLDEPWDSPHNKQLIREMPGVYTSPFTDGHASVEGKTSLHVFIGPADSPYGTVFSPGYQNKFLGIKIRDITDGTSNTLLVVDAGADKAEPWTKPGGLPFDPKGDPKQALGKIPSAGFLVLYADGKVLSIPTTIPAETFRLLLGHNDGKLVPEF